MLSWQGDDANCSSTKLRPTVETVELVRGRALTVVVAFRVVAFAELTACFDF